MPEQLKTPEPPSFRNVTVQGIDWGRALEFVHLFRAFRLAINPAKILIALMAIMLIYGAGRAFDAVWGPQVYVGEIDNYQSRTTEAYKRAREEQNDNRWYTILSRILTATQPDKALTKEEMDALKNSPRKSYRYLKGVYAEKYAKDLEELRKRREEAEQLRSALAESARSATGRSRSPKEIEAEAQERLAAQLHREMNRLRDTVGHGVFDEFMVYEIQQFNGLVSNTLTAVRISPVRASSGGELPVDGGAISNGVVSSEAGRLYRSDTVVGNMSNMFITGPSWLFCGTAPMQWVPENAGTWRGWTKMWAYRGMYLVSLGLLLIFSIAMIAQAGGMICRMTALEIAGVERAPLSQVFGFVGKRLWLFIKLPFVPLLIVLGLGLLLSVMGLVGAIPVVGEVLLGVLFIVVIAVAFVAMLLLLGILGGFHLLYPTLAVEGSDVFDAMSRAFAYVYARPWRMLFYTVVSLVYGAFTLVFVCFAVYLVLTISHVCVGWGTNFFGYSMGWHSGSPKLETLWPVPQYGRLTSPGYSPINWWAMSWSEYFGALALHFWVYLLISAIGAYVVSYYYSAHTMMYMLIRRSVDGQAMEEVYMPEESKAAEKGAIKEAVPAATGGNVTDGPPPM